MTEMLLGGVIGILLGAVLTPAIRPFSQWLERVFRHLWRENPLLVDVETRQDIIWAGDPPWVGFGFFFPDTLPAEAPPDVCVDWTAWARRYGGVDVGVTMLQITLQAKVNTAVVVERLIVRNRVTALGNGVAVACAVGGANLSPRRFEVQLSQFDPPGIAFQLDDMSRGEPPSFVLAAGEVERFHIWARADHDWNEWTVQLPLLVEGTRRLVSVNDSGRPFVTVGADSINRESRFYWSESRWNSLQGVDETARHDLG